MFAPTVMAASGRRENRTPSYDRLVDLVGYAGDLNR